MPFRRRRRLRLSRDTSLFTIGVCGLAYETIHGGERPTLLLVYAACLGLPAFLRADERKAEQDDEPQ